MPTDDKMNIDERLTPLRHSTMLRTIILACLALTRLDLEAEELAQEALTNLRELEETSGCVLLAVK